MTGRWFGAALVLVCALQTACTHVRELHVPLVMRETERPELSELSARTAASAKVFVEPGVDDRPDKAVVGQNREDDTPVPVYWEGTAPVDFVRVVLDGQLRRLGVRVVASPGDATRRVGLTLTEFFVTEGNTYGAEVAGVMSIADASGKTLLERPVRGEARRFGRSLSKENYWAQARRR